MNKEERIEIKKIWFDEKDNCHTEVEYIKEEVVEMEIDEDEEIKT